MPTHVRVPPASGRLLVLAAALIALPAAAADGTAYVSNQQGDVSVIDLSNWQVTGTIPSYGGEPRGIGLTADGKWLVVANRADGGIAVIDRASGKLVRKVAIGENPEFVRVRGHLAFVSYEPASTGKPPPAGGEPDKDDDKKHEPARVAVVDLDKGRVVRAITGGLETEGIEFAADGKHILVTNEEDENITVHEIATGKRIKTIATESHGKRPRGIKMAPDGQHYVATLEFGNAFIVLGPDYAVQQTVKTAESPYGVAFDRAGARLFVAAAKAEVLQVFDARTWAHVKDVPTGKRCWHFSFTPDERHLLVACGRSNEVVVVDAQKLEVVERIADKKLPWGIVTYPKSLGSLDRPE